MHLLFDFKSPKLKSKPKIQLNEYLIDYCNIHLNYLTQLFNIIMIFK
jgi:hypothetical protein